MADIGEEGPAGLVDLAQRFVSLAQLFGTLLDDRLQIGVGILQSLLVGLKIGGHGVEALP